MESVIEEQVEPMDTSELLYSSAQEDIPTTHELETCLEVSNRNTEQTIPMDDTPIERTASVVIDLETDQPYQQEQPTITRFVTPITAANSATVTTSANTGTFTLATGGTPKVSSEATTTVPTVATTTNLKANMTLDVTEASTITKTTRDALPTITIPTETAISIEATLQTAPIVIAPTSSTSSIETEAVAATATETSTTIIVTSKAIDSKSPPPVGTQDVILVEPPASPSKETPELATRSVERLVFTDSGIFDIMTPERAIELYKIIALNGPPDLEWKCYGKRKPREQEEQQDIDESNANKDGESDNPQEPVATGFDFDDEDFGDLETSLPNVGESLRLKKRDSWIERRTNLSDIMSDIMKESHTDGE